MGAEYFKLVPDRAKLSGVVRACNTKEMSKPERENYWNNQRALIDRFLLYVPLVFVVIPRDEKYSHILLDDGSTLGMFKKEYGRDKRVRFQEVREGSDFYHGLLNRGMGLAQQAGASHAIVGNPDYWKFLTKEAWEESLFELQQGKLVVEIGGDIPGLSVEDMRSGLINNSLTEYALGPLSVEGFFGHNSRKNDDSSFLLMGAEGVVALERLKYDYGDDIFAFVESSGQHTPAVSGRWLTRAEMKRPRRLLVQKKIRAELGIR